MKYIIEIDLPDNETIKRVISKCPVHWQIWGYCGDTIAKPSIDIVRCKECRYFSVISDEEEGTNYYMCGVWSNDTDEDAFCSFGKRKE